MSFAHPSWLLLLLIIPILGLIAVLTARLQRKQWAAFYAQRLQQTLFKKGPILPRWLAYLFLLLACAASIIALAGPRADAGTKVEKSLGRNVLIALDISRSMRVSDVKPDRLTQAKVVIYELLDALPNERIGLIAFAGSPFEYAPLTVDHSAVREIVEQIDETWAPLGGSNLAEMVKLGTETLKQTGQKNNALIILSDGEKNEGDLDPMIAEAERSGVLIVAIGVGTADGGFVPNPNGPNGQMVDQTGRNVISRLQPEVMRQLAEKTNGKFILAGGGLDIPNLVKSVIANLDTFAVESRQRRVSVEFYQWLILPAILAFMTAIVLNTRWKRMQLAVLSMGCFLLLENAHASESTEAKRALAKGDFEIARDRYNRLAQQSKSENRRYRYHLGEGVAAYRGKNFRSAREAYTKSLLSGEPEVRAEAHLGMGNTLFQLGWSGLTGEPYPQDGSVTLDLDHFDAVVKSALENLRESEMPDDIDTSGTARFESTIRNWADAARHFSSAGRLNRKNQIALKNRETTMVYLRRLADLLKQEEQDAQQAVPQEQPGQGQPQEGDGEEQPGESGEGEGEPKDGEGEKPDDQAPEDGGEGEEKEKKKGKGKNGEEAEGDEGSTDPNESPEERALRILKENSDLEKGPLTRGRREFRNPKQDW